jgi:hypothetical protein
MFHLYEVPYILYVVIGILAGILSFILGLIRFHNNLIELIITSFISSIIAGFLVFLVIEFMFYCVDFYNWVSYKK